MTRVNVLAIRRSLQLSVKLLACLFKDYRALCNQRKPHSPGTHAIIAPIHNYYKVCA